MTAATAGSSFVTSKLWPGTIPIMAMRFTMGASALAGGLFFINSAISLKNSTPSKRFTWSRTGVCMSIFGSTIPSGAVYALPYALSGIRESWS